MRRPPRPQDDDRDDNNGDNNDDHRRAVETNTGESDGADCYLSLFDNTMIRYVVVAMVEWSIGAEIIFSGDLNVDL